MPCESNNLQMRNYILETAIKIDQMQKEAVIQNTCEGCEGSLMSILYNTKPIIIYLCNGDVLTVRIPETTSTTDLFRIESVRGDSVILRLVVDNAGTLTCTSYTVVFNLGCACCLQCLPPICCERCPRTCENA